LPLTEVRVNSAILKFYIGKNTLSAISTTTGTTGPFHIAGEALRPHLMEEDMRLRFFVLTMMAALLPALPAQKPQPAPGTIADLPVRKVVLYKNGVGYFEHAGTVNGNQKVTVEFTSAQLNDVLQSLTALDSKGGKIGAVEYNSTTPIEQQLNALGLGLKDYPPTLAIYQTLRGQRVEVTGAGAAISGRLVNIEYRQESDKNGASSTDHYYLIVATDNGGLRTAELSDGVTVRMLEPALQRQFASYLEILASAQSQQMRHVTIEDRGEGERQLQVSYISEVPVWKATYRIVFPREADGKATVQGWAVVDNTVGVDWNDVQLSLVAGAPHSFIQPLAEPLYAHRQTIPIATAIQSAPETHEAAESVTVSEAAPEMMNNQLTAPTGIPRRMQMKSAQEAPAVSFGIGYGGGFGSAGGVYQPGHAIDQGDVATKAFDDYFEYALAQPVTIHKNQSAMVPILEQELPVESVTLWSGHGAPLRAIWLDNQSKLTLDAGSFSIFEGGAFAGEGLLEPVHPGEKRLLSYANDEAVKVHEEKPAVARRLRHVAVHEGVMVRTVSAVSETDYTVNNTADETRTVIVEHQRQPKAELESDAKPTESTATAYRFRLVVAPHQTADLRVKERANLASEIKLQSHFENGDELIAAGNDAPALAESLRPAIEAQMALNALAEKIEQNSQKQQQLADDEDRARKNLTALKGNQAAGRFAIELTKAEDEISALRKEEAELEKQRNAAQEKLDAIVTKLAFDTDLDVALKTENK
jgi:hypothetical protein